MALKWLYVGFGWLWVGFFHLHSRPPQQDCGGWTAGIYTARYGVPPAGKKVYLQVNQFVNGWEDLPVTFSAIVPAGA